MIEIQCTSCHTRYRIDERVLPGEAPTFKCSRCGHVFTSERDHLKSTTADQPVIRSDVEKEQSSQKPASDARKQHPYIRPLSAARPKTPAVEPDLSESTQPPEPDHEFSPGSTPSSEPRSATLRRVADVPDADQGFGAGSSQDPRQHHAPGTDEEERDAEDYAPRPTTTASPARGHSIDSDRKVHDANPREDFADPRLNEEEQSSAPENLSFDFDDDEPEIEPEELSERENPDEQWKVGDDDGATGAGKHSESSDPPGLASAAPGPGHNESPLLSATRESVSSLLKLPMDDRVDRFLDRGRHRSAGFFLGLFFLVGLLFAVVTLVVSGTPTSSARVLRELPIIGHGLAERPSLGSKVTLADVHAYYKQIEGGRLALVIAGTATSKASLPLHVVQVNVRVLGRAEQPLITRSVYCGQSLSEKMISQMTPQELDFLQKLGPQKSFVLEPNHSAPFVTVFIDPPKNISRFVVAVTQADEAPVQTASASVLP